jgi:hypothetical protein
MQAQLIATYTDIMGRLVDLPAAIEQAQVELTATRLDLDRDEKAVKDIADSLPPRGANDSERKANKLTDLAGHAPYQRFSQSANANRRSVAVQADQVDSLIRQFTAAGYQAKLHAALLAYLAAAGAIAPDGDINFNMGAKPHVNGNGAGQHMTAADAADLGL